jgi:uncharacterized protein (DUF4415 family)
MNSTLAKEQAQEIIRRSRELNSSMSEEERRDLLERVGRAGEEMTEEEDRAITEDALADPDNPPWNDEFLARRGRPPLDNPKQAIKMRLDADLVAALRASGKGWQTRANGMLRKAMGLK